ncbi:MAG: hypothetical protein WC509_08600 [Candidatus Izemoplasmatales bacterium]
MIRKTLLVFTFLLLLLPALPIVAADMGPKPTATWEIVGIDPAASGLMFRTDDEATPFSEAEMAEYGWDQDPLKVALNGFRDPDGYVLLGLYWPMMHDGMPFFYNGYPTPLKMAVIDDDGDVYVSAAIDYRLYHTELVFDFAGHEPFAGTGVPVAFGTAREVVPVFRILLDFLGRVVLTIALELGVLWLFRYRSKASYRTVAIVNACTQAVLTGFILYGFYWWGESFAALYTLFVGELVVFAGEAVLFAMILREKKGWIGALYALAANALSFGASLLVILLPAQML